MTYGHLQADCLYTGISSGPNARCRVWEAFTFFNLGLVTSPFRNTDRNQNQIQSNRKHIYTYSALRHDWEVQKDNSAKESLTEASIPCWCMFDCWRKQKFINNTRLGSHWIHNQQCTSVSEETRHEQQSLNQKQPYRQSPYLHKPATRKPVILIMTSFITEPATPSITDRSLTTTTTVFHQQASPVKNWRILLSKNLLPTCPCWRQLAQSN